MSDDHEHTVTTTAQERVRVGYVYGGERYAAHFATLRDANDRFVAEGVGDSPKGAHDALVVALASVHRAQLHALRVAKDGIK